MKKQTGITLVALIITIILLLILAGISIATLTGSGLFEKAKLAEQKSKQEKEKEEGILAEYENKIGEYVEGSRDMDKDLPQKYNIITNISTISSNGLHYFDLDISSITKTAKSDGIIAWGSVTNDSLAYNIKYYRIKDDSTIRFFLDGSVTNAEFIFTIIK